MAEKGIITKTIGGFFFTADNQKSIHDLKIRGKIQKKVYPGDYVLFSKSKKIIEEIIPRKNLLYRPKVANVEQILIVQSFQQPPLNMNLIDRFLIMIESVNMEPVIIINKTDLMKETVYQNQFEYYQKIGYPVYFISVKENKNIDSVVKQIKDKVNVLTGPSGAGKSSLINTLIPDANLKIKPVSKNIKRGVHTTRHVELLPLAKGGWVADTPGFSSLDIDYIEIEDLKFLFPEFEKYMNQCKFNMCNHIHEPGCKVKKEVNNGEISAERFQSYKYFYEELKQKEETYD